MRTIDRVMVMLLSLTLLGGVTVARAQQPSLADVARQTAETRKNREKAAKAYTNQDLKSGRPLTVSRASGEKPEAVTAGAGEGRDAAMGNQDAARVKQLRAYVSEKQQEVQRLQQRVSELNDAVLSTFSEEQLQALVKERDAAIAEVRGAQLDVAAQSKAADDLEAALKAAPVTAVSPARVEPPKPQ